MRVASSEKFKPELVVLNKGIVPAAYIDNNNKKKPTYELKNEVFGRK